MNHDIIQLEDYEQFIGAKAVEWIIQKARALQDYHVSHMNATSYHGSCDA